MPETVCAMPVMTLILATIPPLAVKSQHHYKRTSTSQKEAFKVNLLTTGKEMPQITPLEAKIGAYFRRKLIYEKKIIIFNAKKLYQCYLMILHCKIFRSRVSLEQTVGFAIS